MKKSTHRPFALKYRPSNFSELLGQDVLIKTISYSIRNKRLNSAYLLAGIRGVGKTSSARIIAKSINCTDIKNNAGIVIPCEKCENCKSIANNNHPDIIEIDAASKTSVDDIREIIEISEYKPVLGDKKFFIIDEVHMLSKNAFNALLKLIEEPHDHLIFIFATTEVDKIPLTVISRCQRYDLPRLKSQDIKKLIDDISKAEKINIESEATKIIVNVSEGSARDAAKLLDQAVNYSLNSNEGRITADILNNMLGLVRTSDVVDFTINIINGNVETAIEILDRIYSESKVENFLYSVCNFVAELSKRKAISGYQDDIYQNYEISDILKNIALDKLTILWQIFSNDIKFVTDSYNPLISSQMLVIKAVHASSLPEMREVIDASKILINILASKDTEDIYSFLKFCYLQKEMSIYYSLMNDVEIDNFSSGLLSVSGECKEIANGVKPLLKSWSGSDWKIQCTEKRNIISLRNKLTNKIKQSKEYDVIKRNFPEADISEILIASN